MGAQPCNFSLYLLTYLMGNHTVSSALSFFSSDGTGYILLIVYFQQCWAIYLKVLVIGSHIPYIENMRLSNVHQTF